MSYQNPFPFKLPDPPPTTPYSDFFDAFPSMKPASFQAGQIPVADGPQAPGHLPADPSVPPVNPLKALLDAIQSSQNAYQQAADGTSPAAR